MLRVTGGRPQASRVSISIYSCIFRDLMPNKRIIQPNQLACLMIWMGDASRIVKMEYFLTVIIIMRSRNGSFYSPSKVDLYANLTFIRFTRYHKHSWPDRGLLGSSHNWEFSGGKQLDSIDIVASCNWVARWFNNNSDRPINAECRTCDHFCLNEQANTQQSL